MGPAAIYNSLGDFIMEAKNVHKYSIATWIAFLLSVLVTGAVIGAAVWVFLQLMHNIMHILWETIPEALDFKYYTIVLCTIGGVVIGLWRKHAGDLIVPLEETIGEFKKNGRIKYSNMPQLFTSALLPLFFGGSVGPEMGLFTVIAGFISWAKDRYIVAIARIESLNAAGKTLGNPFILQVPLAGLVKEDVIINNEVYNVSKSQKNVMIATAVIGSILTIRLLDAVVHRDHMVFAAFEGFAIGKTEILAFVPLVLLGLGVAFFFLFSQELMEKTTSKLGEAHVLRATIGGFVLGLIGFLLPLTMFSGEFEMIELQATWTEYTPYFLIFLGFVKLWLTGFNQATHFKGGSYFPVMFSSVAIAYGVAEIFGINPEFVVIVLLATITAAALGHAVIVMLLCFLFAPASLGAVLVIVVCSYFCDKIFSPKKILLKRKRLAQESAK